MKEGVLVLVRVRGCPTLLCQMNYVLCVFFPRGLFTPLHSYTAGDGVNLYYVGSWLVGEVRADCLARCATDGLQPNNPNTRL